jgi:uncharacterized protein (TIGR02246 family)
MKCSLVCVFCLVVGSEIRSDEKQGASPEKDIRAVLDEQAAAWNKGDLQAFMKGYWKSNELTFYSGRDKKQGWDETIDRYKKRYQGEGKEMGKLTFSELEVQTIGTDHAVVKGRWKVEMKKDSFDGLFTLIMRKTKDGWRIIHDHTSN